ncbi:MAG: four helix bundle protein [Chitinophagales bacterium]|nr:four helix bundle protein [Chitinophagales bacterium]
MKFEELRVWDKALHLTVAIHNLTLTFPKEERFILTSQIKRAADSVALNIAEGSTGNSNADFKRFLTYSIRSGIEVIACLHIAKARELIDEDDRIKLYNEINELLKSLQALKNSIR